MSFDISETKITTMNYDDQDPNPFLVSEVTAPNGATTKYTYKTNGDLSFVEDTDEKVTQYLYMEDSPGPITDKQRHRIWKIQRPPVTVRKGTPNEAVVTYPPTVFEYDDNGNLEKIIDATTSQETVIGYADDGLVTSITDRNQNTTYFHYEDPLTEGPYRRLKSIDVPKGLSPSDGVRTVSFAYTDADNPDNVTAVTTPAGTSSVDYDVLDRVTQATDARGNSTNFVYLDRVLQEVLLPPNNASEPAQRKISHFYNSNGLLSEVKQDIGPSSQQTRVKYLYNGFYELEELIRLKDTVEKSFLVERDALGRPLTTTDPLQQVTDTAWKEFCYGNSSTSARGVRRILSVDKFCRPSMLEAGTPDLFDKQALEELKESREFQYDELGRLVKIIQKNSIYGEALFGFDRYAPMETTFFYDELDRLREMTFEDGKTMFWDYDPEGNVTRMADPEGKVTEYSYYRDNLLHEVTIKRGDPEAVVGKFVYTYDAAGRLDEIEYPSSTGITAIFRNAADTPGSGFDANGNIRFLRYEKSGVSDPLRSFEWTYDKSNNRESMLDVDSDRAVKWEYGFDWLDRLVTVKRAQADDVGSLTTATLQREYVFDESDNRTFFDDHVNGVTYHYKYKSFDDNGTTRWSDQIEEILISTNVGDRNVSGPGSNFVSFEEFVHDADGNMTKRTIAATSEEIDYDWTEFDRLKRVESTTSGRMQDARYDVNGLRERKRDKNGNSSREYGVGISTATSTPLVGSSAAPSISYIGGHMIMGAEIDGTFVFHLGDALSTVRDVVDDTGAVIKSFEFDEYGNLLNSSGTGTTSPKTWIGGLSVNDDRADSGMFNMGHRNYSAGVLGRFISRDPIGHAGGLNLYAYPTNPVGLTDHSGLNPSVYDSPVFDSYNRGYPTLITGQTRTDVIQALIKMESLDYPDQGSVIRNQLFSGQLHLQKDSPFNVGFTNPVTGNISFDYDYCQSSGQTKEDHFVRLAALLFHEATHRSTQSSSFLGSKGFSAYFMFNPQAKRTLERPIYSAERDFLTKWAQNETNPNVQAALTSNINRCNNAINRLDTEANPTPVKYIWTGTIPVPNQ